MQIPPQLIWQALTAPCIVSSSSVAVREGLELVTRLGDTLGRRGMADITLIDKSRTYLWKPLLHEVAAGSMDFAVQEIEFRAQAHWHHFHYRVGELIGLDRNKREVELASYLDRSGREVVGRRLFRYDTLVVAIGSHGNDFGTPGVREHAILLDSADDAKRFHELLLDSFVRAQAQSEELKPEQINVAIIGAGAIVPSRSCLNPALWLAPPAAALSRPLHLFVIIGCGNQSTFLSEGVRLTASVTVAFGMAV
jgi:hypothetical protein